MSDKSLPLWQPTATIDALRKRAATIDKIREFFHARDVLEVETPILSRMGNTDPAIESMRSQYHPPGDPRVLPLFLHTSPEFFMKRLLAAGSGPIYQIGKVFRDGESGRFHNPEFTMLEWYRPGYDYLELMNEVSSLLEWVAGVDVSEKFTYKEVFTVHAGLSISSAKPGDYMAVLRDHGVDEVIGIDKDDLDVWRDLVLTHVIEPMLGPERPVFIYDYPASQASFAQTKRVSGEMVAMRFELYWKGVEIANGYQELTDAAEQRQRFEKQEQLRKTRGQQVIPMDDNFLSALASGMAPSSGVALGVDRLLMTLLAANNIGDVIAFPLDRV